ncbi:hypothetical protein TARUN_6457 [Trichoderma arundinaceum]|uniref:Uncharacterized protein n=1 Tax=Trichoderma arundinaceum TaxID=490622 RepID=A0A395NIH4_TRIAR|nr:hypothetical protein TARUN_6457 [Trichoderma arundinaceum]
MQHVVICQFANSPYKNRRMLLELPRLGRGEPTDGIQKPEPRWCVHLPVIMLPGHLTPSGRGSASEPFPTCTKFSTTLPDKAMSRRQAHPQQASAQVSSVKLRLIAPEQRIRVAIEAKILGRWPRRTSA